MGNKTIFRVVMCIIILSTFILPVSAQQPDKTNEYEVSLKKLMEVTGAWLLLMRFYRILCLWQR